MKLLNSLLCDYVKICQLRFSSMFRLFDRFVASVSNLIPVDLQLVFGANAIVWPIVYLATFLGKP